MDDENAKAHEDADPVGVMLLLVLQGAIWLGAGLLLGRVIWGPAF